MRMIQVLPGDCRVSSAPEDWLGTLLGSCISVCLRDPCSGIGAMNHYLLARGAGPQAREDLRYGEAAMPRLLRTFERKGSNPSQLEAKVFGGARVMAGVHDIGARDRKSVV